MSADSRCLILAGPTREYIDPVRYISNASSGLQGMALAEEALGRGYEVAVINVVSAAEMLAAARERHPDCAVLIGAAAVSDFRPETPHASKRKSGGDDLDLRLEATEDILALLGRGKDSRVHAGFALETEDHLANARGKLEAKNLDWIVVNDAAAIGRESGDYHILGADGSEHPLGRLDKRELASQLLDRIEASAACS